MFSLKVPKTLRWWRVGTVLPPLRLLSYLYHPDWNYKWWILYLVHFLVEFFIWVWVILYKAILTKYDFMFIHAWLINYNRYWVTRVDIITLLFSLFTVLIILILLLFHLYSLSTKSIRLWLDYLHRTTLQQ